MKVEFNLTRKENQNGTLQLKKKIKPKYQHNNKFFCSITRIICSTFQQLFPVYKCRYVYLFIIFIFSLFSMTILVGNAFFENVLQITVPIALESCKNEEKIKKRMRKEERFF